MGAIATFDWTVFSTRYPEFAYIGEPLATAYWEEATLYHDNTGVGPVGDATAQRLYLNMLTAHIAMMNSGLEGQGPSGLVGRVSSATEGSVSVSVENNYPPGTVQWYQTTRYGSAYYAAVSKYRRALYIGGPNMLPSSIPRVR